MKKFTVFSHQGSVRKKTQAVNISAQVNVGFGNTLYVRGAGPGLSWEKGLPLDCVADDKWSISLSNVRDAVVFKFLVNDLIWSTSDDCTVQPGGSGVFTPMF